MSESRDIRSIAVAGGGITGLSAAIAFARALPMAAVTLIDIAADPSALADRLPTALPSAARFHAFIGLEERELVRAGIAVHHLGTIFDHWGKPGTQWVEAFGDYGKPAGGVPFDQIWVRAHRTGEALPYDRYSVAATLARAGKFAHPSADPNSVTSRFLYGLRFDPGAYRERLRAQAQASKVRFIEGEIAQIEAPGSLIAAVQLTDGSRVEADLFVDCTGPSARLLSELDDSFEDWSAWMPFDRLLLSEHPRSAFPAPSDTAEATGEGWSAEWPLPRRVLHADLRVGGEGTPVVRGRRLRPWVGNVLAIGDAATALDPLHGRNLAVAQEAILLALELLPGRDFDPVETGEYNRRAEQLTRRVRDFVALHYLRSGRTDGVWAAFADREPPDSLARTLDQFGYRGRLPFHEEETVSRDSWTAALIGLGVLPAHADPQSEAIPLDKAVPAMRQLAREIDHAVASVPPYRDYLARMIG